MDRARTTLIAIRRILRVTELSARALTRETGLNISQLLVLQILEEIGETTAGNVAARANLKQATVTSLLDKLEQRGLVRRKRGESDRRKVWIELLPAGHEALANAPDMLQERFRARFQELPDWEQAYLMGALERVAALLDAEDLHPETEDAAARAGHGPPSAAGAGH